MAKKLSLQIKLEGGKEIKRELAEMGEEGKKAFLEINKAAKQVGGFDKLDPNKLAQVNSELKKIGVSAAEIDKVSDAVGRATRTERLVGAVRAVEGGFENLTSTVKLAGLAFGPMGLAMAVVAEKASGMVGALTGASEAINKVGEAAAKAGLSIEKYDQIRASLEKGGVSPGGIEQALQKIAEVGEKGQLDKVAVAVKQLQEVMAQGSDPRTSTALQQLMQMAEGFGPVADAAKKALADLNIHLTAQEQKLMQLASSGSQSLSQLGATVAVQGHAYATALAEMVSGTDTAQGKLLEFIRQLEGIRDPAERNAIAMRELSTAGLEIAKGIQTGAISSKQAIQEITATLTQATFDWSSRAEETKNKISAAWGRMFETGDISQLGTVFSEIGNLISLGFERASHTFGPMFSRLATSAGTVWETFSNAATTAISTVSSALDGLIAKLERAIQLAGAMSGGGGGAPQGHASGGLIGGRGSGTSDSNLALVSRGEYITPARAVAQPGVLAFLEALRRSGGNLSQVLNGLGRYAAGGLVMPSLPSGSVGGMNHVTIQFPGLSPITGLRASSQVVEELRRSAAMAQVRSGGRKPSRYT